MWVDPKYRDQVQAPTAPQERGERLATFKRGDGQELRVTLAEYEGHPFISLRLWERDQAGTWWPIRGKGCSVRMSEAAELAEALVAVASGTGRSDPPRTDARPPVRVRGRGDRQPWDASKLAPATRPTEGFDEFE